MLFNDSLLTLLILLALFGNAHCGCSFFNEAGLCDYFQSWSALSDYAEETVSTETSFINIRPNEPIPVTSDFDMTVLIKAFSNGSELQGQQHKKTFNMLGINGIDLMPWSTPNTNLTLAIAFVQSQIDFLINGTEISDDKCSADMISKYGDKTNHFFNLFTDVTFEQLNGYPRTPICFYMFSLAKLNSLSIYNLIDSIVVSNVWRFKSVTTNETTINSAINTLNVGGYGYDLDTSLRSLNRFIDKFIYLAPKRFTIQIILNN
jgi:hypothetical protein